MDPLRDLTLDAFSGLAGETFHHADAGIDLVLVEVADLSVPGRALPEGGRAPFSLVFAGPNEPELVQAIHPLRHDGLGELLIFLVPIAREADGMRYEAVFN